MNSFIRMITLIGMILSFDAQSQDLGPHAKIFVLPEEAASLKPTTPQRQEQFIAILGDKMHETWQEQAKASGKKDRFRPILLASGPIKTQNALDDYFNNPKRSIPNDLRKFYEFDKIKGSDDLVAVEDILHIPNRFLAPNNSMENSESAKVAINLINEEIQSRRRLNREFLYKASIEIHNQWVLRNPWVVTEKSPLRKHFDELSEVEAEKDYVIIKDAILVWAQNQNGR